MIDLEVAYIERINLVITGFKGYLGSNLLLKLNAQEEIKKLSALTNKGIKNIIHLAAKVDTNISTISNNIQLDMHVIEFCKTNSCNLIYASSNNIYPYARNCKDNYEFHKSDYYGASKILTEQILKNVANVKYVSLRIGDVFGIDQKHGNFFKNIQSSITEEKDLSLFGQGLKVRNYIFIDDLINVLIFLSTQDIITSKSFNIAYKEPVSIFQIICYINQFLKIPIQKISYDISKELTDFRTLDYTEIKDFNFTYDIWSALDKYITTIKGQ